MLTFKVTVIPDTDVGRDQHHKPKQAASLLPLKRSARVNSDVLEIAEALDAMDVEIRPNIDGCLYKGFPVRLYGRGRKAYALSNLCNDLYRATGISISMATLARRIRQDSQVSIWTLNDFRKRILKMGAIKADGAELMFQASATAHTYTMKAVEYIDDIFGEGFAKKNPALVGAFIQAAAIDLAGAIIAQQINDGLEDVANALESLQSTD